MKISDFYQKEWQEYPWRKRLKFYMETFFAYLGYSLLSFLGPRKASKFCVTILSFIGPFMPISKMVKRNITRSMPDKSEAEIELIVKDVWKNFALIIAEFPFIQQFDTFDEKRVILEGWKENYESRKEDSKGVVFFSCHTGNWEYISKVAEDRGVHLWRVFKAPSNPLVFPLFTKRVTAQNTPYLLPANRTAIIKCMRALKQGEPVALLTDQKYQKGLPIPFFGRNAPTNSFIAELALKNNVDILPCRTIRLKDGRFKIVLESPLIYDEGKDQQTTKINILTAMNSKIESWVREYPGQWFWLHKRWGRED